MTRLSVFDPTGLVPVVKEVERRWEQSPSTCASTGTRPVGGVKERVNRAGDR